MTVTACSVPQVAGVAEDELPAVLGQSSALGVGQEELFPRGCRAAHHSVRPCPAQDLDRQAGQQVGDARGVVSGVQHDQDVRIALGPLARRDEPFDHLADLGGGDRRPGRRRA